MARRHASSQRDYHVALADYARAIRDLHASQGKLLQFRGILEQGSSPDQSTAPRQIPDPARDLQPGDRLTIEIFVDESMSREVTILADGSITLPLLGQVQAAGRSLVKLRDELEEQYSKYYREPSLLVSFSGTSERVRR